MRIVGDKCNEESITAQQKQGSQIKVFVYWQWQFVKVDRLKVRSIFPASQTRQMQLVACWPEKPQIFRFTGQTESLSKVGVPTEIKTKIRYHIICCYLNFTLWNYDNNKLYDILFQFWFRSDIQLLLEWILINTFFNFTC